MGWNPRLGVQGRVYAPTFHLFSMYARLYVSLGCIHGFCTGSSAFVSGMFGVFQPLLMYQLIT